MKERLTLVVACAASVLLSAIAVTGVYLLTQEAIPPLGSLKWVPLSGRLNLCFFVAFVHAAILGIPAFLLIRHRRQITLLLCAVWGFAIGAVPLGILSLLSQFGLESASTGNVPTVVNHVPTLFGLWELFKFIGPLGVMGLVGGCGFWAGLWSTGGLRVINSNSSAPRFFGIRSVLALSLTLIAASAIVHFIPAAAEDRSCHNMFLDGRKGISPVLSVNLDVSQSEWRDVREFFRRFSASHGLSLQDGEDFSGVGLSDALGLDLCDGKGTNISVTAYNQSEGGKGLMRGLPIEIYLVHNNSGWKSLARDFIEALQQSWPGKVEFRDKEGKVGPRPKVLDQK